MAVGGNGANVALQALDLIEVVFTCREPSNVQNGLNVRHYVVSQLGPSGATLGMVATQANTNTFSQYKALLSAGASFWGVSARRVWPRPLTAIAWDTTNQGAGLVVGDILPRQSSGLISFATNLAGPSYRGRAYAPFPSEASNDPGGVPSAAYIGALQNLANVLVGVMVVNGPNGAQLSPILWHRGAPAQPSFTAVTSTTVRSKWATQRRRGDFGRLNPPPF